MVNPPPIDSPFSHASVLPAPEDDYGRSKQAAEEGLRSLVAGYKNGIGDHSPAFGVWAGRKR